MLLSTNRNSLFWFMDQEYFIIGLGNATTYATVKS